MVRRVLKLGTNEEFACKSIAKQTLRGKKDVEDMKREIKVKQGLNKAELNGPNFGAIHEAYKPYIKIDIVLHKGDDAFGGL